MKQQSFTTIHVRSRPGYPSQGQLIAGGRVMRCALGRSGMGIIKREGDGKTPIGSFKLTAIYRRPGRFDKAHHALPGKLIGHDDGWCDAVGDRNYNRPVGLPYAASHEVLLRKDHLYDVFFVMDYNVSQNLKRGGSAIFFHLAHEDYRPTEGCVAISRADMCWLYNRIGRNTWMVIS